jgi:hypothetical protein
MGQTASCARDHKVHVCQDNPFWTSSRFLGLGTIQKYEAKCLDCGEDLIVTVFLGPLALKSTSIILKRRCMHVDNNFEVAQDNIHEEQSKERDNVFLSMFTAGWLGEGRRYVSQYAYGRCMDCNNPKAYICVRKETGEEMREMQRTTIYGGWSGVQHDGGFVHKPNEKTKEMQTIDMTRITRALDHQQQQ